jgi:hypothetical protein
MQEVHRQITDLQDFRTAVSESDVLCARLKENANALVLEINRKLITTCPTSLLSLKLLRLEP